MSTEEFVRATFSDGATDTADLLLGCDGIHSTVRHVYVEPARDPEYSGMAALGSTIPSSLLSESAASQLRGMHG